MQDEFKSLLNQAGWVFKRQSGSHAIWHSLTGYRLVIQEDNGKAKRYQELAVEAAARGLSLNAFISQRLAATLHHHR